MDAGINPDTIKAIDRSDMLEKIRELPHQLRTGWELGNVSVDPIQPGRFRHIIVGGMGGSAITGDLLASILRSSLSLSFSVNRGYTLPEFAGPETLFIASSYSGNTEETLSSTRQAIDRGCEIICITSGGKLGALADEHQFFRVALPPGYPPRAALGYNLGLFLALFNRMGLSELTEETFEEAVHFIEKTLTSWEADGPEDNPPLRTARSLEGRIPLVYASADLAAPIGFRWKTQINENAKAHIFFFPLPEMNHNEIMGWQALPATQSFFQHLTAVFLRMEEDHPRIQKRFEITGKIIEENGQPLIDILAEGPSTLARILYLIAFGDMVSFYLAILYEVDPTEINNINTLKEHLSRSE